MCLHLNLLVLKVRISYKQGDLKNFRIDKPNLVHKIKIKRHLFNGLPEYFLKTDPFNSQFHVIGTFIKVAKTTKKRLIDINISSFSTKTDRLVLASAWENLDFLDLPHQASKYMWSIIDFHYVPKYLMNLGQLKKKPNMAQLKEFEHYFNLRITEN